MARGPSLRSLLQSRYAVVPVLAIAATLRLLCLDSQPLSGDEAMHLHPLSFAEVLRFDLMFNPPLFRLLVQGALRLCPLVIAARLVPLCAGTGAVWLLYLLAYRLTGRTTALTAALLLAVHPWHIFHSQTIRAFALLTFLTLLAQILRPAGTSPAPETHPGPRTIRILGHVLVHAFSLLTHYLSVFAILADVALLWRKGRRHHAAALLAVPLLIGLALAAWLAGGVAEKTVRGGIGDHTAGLPYLLDLARCCYAPGGLALAASLALSFRGFLSPALRPCAVHAAAWIAGPALLGLFIPIEVRYALPVLPLLLLGLAHGTTQLLESTSGLRRAGVAAAFLAGTAGIVFLLPAYYHGAADPEKTTRLHRDLVHAEFLMHREVELLASQASATMPIVLAAEGPLRYRLLLELAGGTAYPRDAQLTHTHRGTELAGGDFRIIKAPAQFVAESGYLFVAERRPPSSGGPPAHGCLLFDHGGHIVVWQCPPGDIDLNH